MCSFLNLQIMLILNCFALDRNSLLQGDDKSERTDKPGTSPFLDNPGLVVGIFLQKSDKQDFVAVGIAISEQLVVTACVPLVKQFRGPEIVTYDKEISVVAIMDLKEQERIVSSVECFYMDGQTSIGKSSIGKGFLGVLKMETPFETETKEFVTVSSTVLWDVSMRCKLYYYSDRKDQTFSFALQSFDVVSVLHRNSCSEFILAETGIEPGSNQLCGFPLFPYFSPCDAVVPGSPVFCSGSHLVGLTENSSFSTLAGRCFFLVDAFTAVSTHHRPPLAGRATSSDPQMWLLSVLLIWTFLYRRLPPRP